MANKLDALTSFKKQALDLRMYRQQTIAANIANADTPHYQARDIDFRGALQDAQAGRKPEGSLEVARTNARHIEGTGSAGLAPLLYRTPYQASADGNTVDMDMERSNLAENSVHLEFLLNSISGDFKKMQTALSGQSA